MAPEGVASACADCGAPLAGRFCAACGQDAAHRLDRPLRALVAELASETLGLDGRVARTLAALVRRPGAVAAEFMAGRRTRWTSPLRLYLAASLLFFVVAALRPSDSVNVRIAVPGAPAVTTPEERARIVADEVAPLRGLGGPGRALADRLVAVAGMPPGEAQRRFDAAFAENGPRVLFFLVPLLALGLKALHRRRFDAQHLVLALHVLTVGFVALLPGELLSSETMQQLGVAATVAWAAVALRRTTGDRWWVVVPKVAALALGFALAWALLVGGIAAAALLAA